MLAAPRGQPDPARREHAQHMSVRKERGVAFSWDAFSCGGLIGIRKQEQARALIKIKCRRACSGMHTSHERGLTIAWSHRTSWRRSFTKTAIGSPASRV